MKYGNWKDELTPGTYYTIHFKGRQYIWIVEWLDKDKREFEANGICFFPDSVDNSYYNQYINFCNDPADINYADNMQIRWVKECKSQGKTVPYEQIEVTENYQIF
jgi:hypothetical protein